MRIPIYRNLIHEVFVRIGNQASRIYKMNKLQELFKQTNWFEGKETPLESEILSSLRNIDIGSDFTPEEGNIFKAFQLTKYKDIKVVILGQDPYYTKGAATGLAFAVPKGNKIQPSLKNIFSVAKIDPNADTSLTGWAKQGVFLLNTALTTRIGMPNAHSARWKEFTKAILECLELRKDIRYLLWVGNAQKMIVRRDENVLRCSHPSPLGWSKTESPFAKSCHFEGIKEINWKKTA
jgi:uracil-DNA glycosylase